MCSWRRIENASHLISIIYLKHSKALLKIIFKWIEVRSRVERDVEHEYLTARSGNRFNNYHLCQKTEILSPSIHAVIVRLSILRHNSNAHIMEAGKYNNLNFVPRTFQHRSIEIDIRFYAYSRSILRLCLLHEVNHFLSRQKGTPSTDCYTRKRRRACFTESSSGICLNRPRSQETPGNVRDCRQWKRKPQQPKR